MKTRTAAALVSITISQAAWSQVQPARLEAGLTAGMVIYQGDLTPLRPGAVNTPGFNANIFGSYLLNRSYSIRGNIVLGSIRGDDATYSTPDYRRRRNFQFSGLFGEFTGLLVWNIRANNGNEPLKKIHPYVFAGAGVSMLRITRDWSRFNAEYFSGEPDVLQGLEADISHPMPRVIPVVPLGAGARYFISERLSVIAEGSYRLTETDYLDGFSKAANADRKDHYTTVNVGIVYRLGTGKKYDCPVVMR
ncbi:MAG TPA: outer membrane beta-barrel protein [Flavisolibacter sp.]